MRSITVNPNADLAFPLLIRLYDNEYSIRFSLSFFKAYLGHERQLLDVTQLVHKRGTLEHWKRKYKLANIETDYHDAFGFVFKTNRLISTLKKGILTMDF